MPGWKREIICKKEKKTWDPIRILYFVYVLPFSPWDSKFKPMSKKTCQSMQWFQERVINLFGDFSPLCGSSRRLGHTTISSLQPSMLPLTFSTLSQQSLTLREHRWLVRLAAPARGPVPRRRALLHRPASRRLAYHCLSLSSSCTCNNTFFCVWSGVQ